MWQIFRGKYTSFFRQIVNFQVVFPLLSSNCDKIFVLRTTGHFWQMISRFNGIWRIDFTNFTVFGSNKNWSGIERQQINILMRIMCKGYVNSYSSFHVKPTIAPWTCASSFNLLLNSLLVQSKILTTPSDRPSRISFLFSSAQHKLEILAKGSFSKFGWANGFLSLKTSIPERKLIFFIIYI